MPLFADWDFEPTIILGIAIASIFYGLSVAEWRWRYPGSRPVGRVQIACFATAMLTLVVALLSPIDTLADKYLLSVHMVQHLMLTLVMPPLLLLGLPDWMVRPILRIPAMQPVLLWLTRPLPAFILFNAVFAGWHAPDLYEATLQNPYLHILEHVMFMATATIMWWPVVGPLPEIPRASYPLQVLYLFLLSVIPTILGAIITFADGVLYSTYLNAPRVWGISAEEDQQWGGMIMWIPGALAYLTALTVVFFVWFEGQEKAGEIR